MESRGFVLFQDARCRAVGETIPVAGAFNFQHLVHVINVLQPEVYSAIGANPTAEAAGNTETYDALNPHSIAECFWIRSNR